MDPFEMDDQENEDLKGARLRITLPGDMSYTGIVQSIDMSVPRLSLKVIDESAGSRHRPKIMNFFGEELNDIEVLESAEDDEDAVSPAKKAATVSVVTPGSSTEKMRSQHTNRHDVASKFSRSGSSSQANEHERVLRDRENVSLPVGGNARHVTREEWIRRVTEEPARPITHAPISHRPNIGLPLSSDYICLTEVNQEYRDSIAVIMDHMVIGFACQGAEISRKGEISLIQICCRKGIYIFDALQLGIDGIVEGLGDVICSPNIMKVVHDCRKMSDAFHHLYGLELVNVFDTQVGDWMIRRTEAGGMVPMHVNSYRFCLQRYLRLRTFEVQFSQTLTTTTKETPEVWRQRPLPTPILDAASRVVHYLPALRLVMMESLMAEFVQAIDVYLSAARDTPDGRDFSACEVLPELQKEFAINVGLRNYAAPGRATSPERDGLHSVPRTFTHDTREIEARFDNFVLHRNVGESKTEFEPSRIGGKEAQAQRNHVDSSALSKPLGGSNSGSDSDSSKRPVVGLGRGMAIQSLSAVRRPGASGGELDCQSIQGPGRTRMPFVDSRPSRPPSRRPQWNNC